MLIVKTHLIHEYIESFIPKASIIIEAGGFDGTDTVKLVQKWPEGTVHVFEPVPVLFEKLKNKTAHYENVILYECALSDSNGFSNLYVAEKPEKPGMPCQASSLLKPKKRLLWSPIQFPQKIAAPTVTLDSWAKANGIDHIDLLWLDVQGMELPILKAAQNILKTVKAIYTEVHFDQAYEQVALYDEVKSWLEMHDFEEIARTFHDTTSWFFGNVLFVKK